MARFSPPLLAPTMSPPGFIFLEGLPCTLIGCVLRCSHLIVLVPQTPWRLRGSRSSTPGSFATRAPPTGGSPRLGSNLSSFETCPFASAFLHLHLHLNSAVHFLFQFRNERKGCFVSHHPGQCHPSSESLFLHINMYRDIQAYFVNDFFLTCVYSAQFCVDSRLP